VTDNETSTDHSTAASPAPRRRAPVKRRASARKPPARKSAAARRPRSRARTATNLAAILDGLATKAAAAGKEMKTLSGQGTDVARRAMKDAGTASKKTIARLAKEWKGMDSARRAKFVAALLAALAAASAPIVRAGLKKK
jgi:hypothetical protein